MKLDKFHVFERNPCVVGQVTTTSGIDNGIGGPQVDSAVSPGGQDDGSGVKKDNFSLKEVESEKTGTPSLLNDQGEGIPFLINRNLQPCDLFVKHVEKVVAGPVGRITGPGKAGPAKRTLGDFSLFRPGKESSPVLHFDHPFDCIPAHQFRRILIGQVVSPLDGVKGMPFPRILYRNVRIGERGVDPALGRHGVGPQGMDLGKDRDVPSRPPDLDGRSQTGQSSADHQNIVR